MKKITFLVLASFLFFSSLFGQHIYQSACTAHDTIIKKYRKDAARLAVRYVYKNQLPYKDSLHVDKALEKRYLDAIIAVYNATVFPARDTVFNLFNIHTNNMPGLNALEVNAPDTVYWMEELFNNMAPTTNTTIAYYYTKYHMQDVYYQAQPYDKVVFSTDSNLNLVHMQQAFSTVTGVASAAVLQPFNDTRNITDTLDPNFIVLTFDYGWNTCLDTCDYHKYWTFKVFNDCKVQYRGHSGKDLNTGILDHRNTNQAVNLYPNPTSGKITLSAQTLPVQLMVTNLLGEKIFSQTILEKETAIDLSAFPDGLYVIQLSGDNYSEVRKIIKE